MRKLMFLFVSVLVTAKSTRLRFPRPQNGSHSAGPEHDRGRGETGRRVGGWRRHVRRLSGRKVAHGNHHWLGFATAAIQAEHCVGSPVRIAPD